jgi:hypothetical protein
LDRLFLVVTLCPFAFKRHLLAAVDGDRLQDGQPRLVVKPVPYLYISITLHEEVEAAQKVGVATTPQINPHRIVARIV